MRAKSFFYVSLGILALAVAYHLGATNATAQAPSNPVVATFPDYGRAAVVTANGDVYYNTSNLPWANQWARAFNVFTNSAPTLSVQKSWGQVKVD